MTDEPLELIVADADAWRTWLEEHHRDRSEIWLVLAKKGTTEPTSLNYQQALEEALCFGWIDGRGGSRDAATHRQRFTPRRPRSPWSKRNVGIAERLVAEGRMHPAGLAEIDRAKADGRWRAAYEGASSIEMPPELERALEASPDARARFARLSGQNRYAILYRIATAKRPDTRTRRAEQFVGMLLRGETPYPQTAPIGDVAGSPRERRRR